MLVTLKSQWQDELFNWVNSLFNTDRVFPSWEVLKPESAGCQASTLPRLSVLGLNCIDLLLLESHPGKSSS